MTPLARKLGKKHFPKIRGYVSIGIYNLKLSFTIYRIKSLLNHFSVKHLSIAIFYNLFFSLPSGVQTNNSE